MNRIQPLVWLGALTVLACGLFFLVAYLNPSNVGDGHQVLTKKQERVEQTSLAKQHQRGKIDTLQAAALTASAARTHEAATTLRQEAILIHKLSKSHATPTPTTSTGLDSLQRLLATYGDSPAAAISER